MGLPLNRSRPVWKVGAGHLTKDHQVHADVISVNAIFCVNGCMHIKFLLDSSAAISVVKDVSITSVQTRVISANEFLLNVVGETVADIVLSSAEMQ